MAWGGAASRSLLAAVRVRSASSSSSAASRLRAAAPLPAAPRRRVPAFAFATVRPLAAMAGSPVAVVAITGHTAVCVRACCELSQATLFCRTGQDR